MRHNDSVRLLRPLVTLFLISSMLSAQTVMVEDVEIRGNRNVTSEEIRKRIKTTAGSKFDPEQLKKDLESVMSIGKFDKLKSSVVTEKGVRDGVVVIFRLVELP